MLIVICGPYSGETQWEVEENVRRAQDAAQRLLAAGHAVICPHTMTHGWQGAYDLKYEDFMRSNLEAVRRADAILYLGTSPGAERELALAIELEKLLYHEQDIPYLERSRSAMCRGDIRRGDAQSVSPSTANGG